MGPHCPTDRRPTLNMKITLAMLLLGAVVACAMAEDPEAKSEGYGKDLGGKYDGYFQYANVPSPYEYEFGYNRGNPAHFTSRYEQAKEGRFRTKVKWPTLTAATASTTTSTTTPPTTTSPPREPSRESTEDLFDVDFELRGEGTGQKRR